MWIVPNIWKLFLHGFYVSLKLNSKLASAHFLIICYLSKFLSTYFANNKFRSADLCMLFYRINRMLSVIWENIYEFYGMIGSFV